MTARRTKPATRYPTTPLLAETPPGINGIAILASRLGVERGAIYRWKKHGITLTPYQADKYAIRLGHHPSHYWPTWFDDALNDK
jgi:hypothetical protein